MHQFASHGMDCNQRLIKPIKWRIMILMFLKKPHPFSKKLDHIDPYIPGQSIETIQQQYGLSNIIKLASNENPLGPAIDFRECAASVERYPDYSTHPLISNLAETYGIPNEQIILGNGSDELLLLIGLACIDPGDEIISSQCTFSEYKFVATITGATFIETPMTNFRYDISAIIDCVTPKTKLIFIANPNNPTGTYVSHTDIRRLLTHISTSTLVVLDEAYAEYVSAPDYPNALELMHTFPNVMITRTFSKIYGLAALRIGYGIGTAPVIQAISTIRPPFNVNGIALCCANAALKNTRFVEESTNVNRNGKAYLLQQLASIPCTIPDSHANFLYIAFPDSVNVEHLCMHLLQRGIIVRFMKSFGQKNALRVTIGTQQQNEAFINGLHECLNQL